MYIQTATSRMQHVHDYTSLTCDPGRADRVNLPRVLSPHEEATVRCAKARPGSNSSSGSQAPVRSKTSGPHASAQHTAAKLRFHWSLWRSRHAQLIPSVFVNQARPAIELPTDGSRRSSLSAQCSCL